MEKYTIIMIGGMIIMMERRSDSGLHAVGGLELSVKDLNRSIDPVVETENLEDKFSCKGRSSSLRGCIRAIWRYRYLVRKKRMTPRIKESAPRNESTVMMAIRDPASRGDDTASLCGEGDGVGDDDACCGLECDCALGADEVDVVVGDGVTGVEDTNVERGVDDVVVAGLAVLCEVIVTNEAAGTTGDGE